MMKLTRPLFYILATLTLPLAGTVAPAASLTIVQTFDYPDFIEPTAATLPQKVSDQGDLVGTVVDTTGAVQGFIYKVRLGRFSAAFHDPDDTGRVTQGRGINNRRHVVGEYLNGSDGTFHGYKLLHPSFVNFDVTGALDTIPLGINNVGDFVGTVIFSDGTQPAFVSLRGKVTTFAVPEATATFAYQLNSANEIIGYYIDSSGITHGYTRDSAGILTFPIDVAGATGTILFGNNDSNGGVGRYTDASGVTHGLYFITPDDIQSYDYPGATFTSLNGINKLGMVVGYYVDTAGVSHGLVAQVNATGTSKPNTSIPVAPVKLVQPSPEMLKIGATPAL